MAQHGIPDPVDLSLDGATLRGDISQLHAGVLTWWFIVVQSRYVWGSFFHFKVKMSVQGFHTPLHKAVCPTRMCLFMGMAAVLCLRGSGGLRGAVFVGRNHLRANTELVGSSSP